MRLYADQLILLTGGAGFIGSAVLKTLNNKGLTNIVVVDEFDSSEKWKNLVGKRFTEVLQKEELFSWLEGRENLLEAVIHLGACSSTVEKDSSYLLETNYRFSQKLAEFALKNSLRFIYASSAATYGDGQLGFSDDHELLPTLRPLNMYGYSKHLFDLWLLNEGLLNQVTGLKYFNVFGPNEWHKGRMASCVYHFYQTLKREKTVSLFSSSEPDLYPDGGQKRDFIYVKDAALITTYFLKYDAFGIFNVGSGKARTFNDLAKALFQAAEAKESIRYIDMPEDLRGKYQNYTCADTRKLKQALGDDYSTVSLEKGVFDYVRKHLDGEKFW